MAENNNNNSPCLHLLVILHRESSCPCLLSTRRMEKVTDLKLSCARCPAPEAPVLGAFPNNIYDSGGGESCQYFPCSGLFMCTNFHRECSCVRSRMSSTRGRRVNVITLVDKNARGQINFSAITWKQKYVTLHIIIVLLPVRPCR